MKNSVPQWQPVTFQVLSSHMCLEALPFDSEGLGHFYRLGSCAGQVGLEDRAGRVLGEAQEPTLKAVPIPRPLPALDHSQHPWQLQPLFPVRRRLGGHFRLDLRPGAVWALRGVHCVPHDLLEEEPPQVPLLSHGRGRLLVGQPGARSTEDRAVRPSLGRAR